MEQSLLSAVSGIDANQTYLDVIGNNIANANTTGYRSQEVNFTDLMSQQLAGATLATTTNGGLNPLSVGSGTRIGAITSNQTEGAPQLTGNPTDVAIQGTGYLVAVQNGQTLYTRAGDLTVDGTGNLTTKTGALIQGWQGTNPATTAVISNAGAPAGISIPNGLTNAAGANLETYSIGGDGVISGSFSDGTSAPIAQLAMASVTNPNGLDAIGGSMYTVTPNSGTLTVGAPGSTGLGTLLGGNLETSNVDLSNQLTNLIVAQEAYQANTKVITTTSTVLQALMSMP
jgi:flagellar hook protein FlgE